MDDDLGKNTIQLDSSTGLGKEEFLRVRDLLKHRLGRVLIVLEVSHLRIAVNKNDFPEPRENYA